MKSLSMALGAAVLLCACSDTGAPAPVIASFTAAPGRIAKGGSATLSWQVTGATQVAIDNGVGLAGGNTATVSPSVTTTYTLTATGGGGTATKAVTVVVDGALRLPAINSFTATPASIGRGASSTLSWTVQNASAVVLTPDGSAQAGASLAVSPLQTTTYTLTATGPGGQASAQVTVAVHDPVPHLDYVDPGASAGGLRLVKSRSSTDARLVLDLLVGTLPVTGFGVALNLPFDTTRARLSAQTPLLPNGAALDPGTGPALAAAVVPSSGPLAGALVLGVARKKRYANEGDVLLPPGTLILSVAFDLVAGAPAGTVFDGVHPGARFEAGLVKADGTRSVDKAGFAIGQLSVAN